MPDAPVDGLIELIRPQIRNERPYVVGGARDVGTKLNQNESPYDLPPALKRELLEAFFQIPFNRYPKEQPEKLIAAISRQIGRPESSIIVGNGSNELTYTLGLCMVQGGAEVVLPRPMFALYESMVRMFGGQPIGIAPREDLTFDADAVLEAVRSRRPVLTILASPNNPTGLAMEFDEIRAIAETAYGFVVVDEAYHEFNPRPSALSLMEEHPNVIVFRTLSKAMGLAGLRLGYLTAHPDVATEIMKSRLPFMVDPLSEHVGLALLRNEALIRKRVAELLEQRSELVDAMTRIEGVDVLPSDTNFVLFRTGSDPKALLASLADRDVLVRNVSGYPELAGFLRVSVGTERENKAFLAALKHAL